MTGVKKIIFTVTFWLLLSAVNFRGIAQQEITNNIVTSLHTYNKQNPREKLFIHTDRTFYTCGEILWFKLYTVDATINKPIAASKIAYVELLKGNQKIIFQAKIELKDGSGSGSFSLPFSLNSGSYLLRAYTNWMKNYSADFFFETPLTIVNTLKKLSSAVNDTPGYDIRFFPEGGSLVNGFESKVAFHAVDQNGKGVFCKGTLFNQLNDSITSFGSLGFGMGHFRFTPIKGDSYKAIVQTSNGETITRSIPAASESGYVMQLQQPDSGTLKIVVQSGYNNENVFLLMHTRQIIKRAEIKAIENGVAEFVINRNDLGDGVSHFTLFNNKRQPVCERLYFLLPKKKLNLLVNTDKATYGLREKVNMQLKVAAANEQSATADISLSVFPADSLQQFGESDIESYLWLSSELKGDIESPRYYFSSKDSMISEVTDNLMLTQGWSRFKWEEIMKRDRPSFRFLPEYEGPIITGKITDRISGLPATDVTVWMTVPGERFSLSSTTSNTHGILRFNLPKFYGSNELILQPDVKKENRYIVNLDDPFAANFSSRKNFSFRIDKKWERELLSYSINTQVENTYVQEKKERFLHFTSNDSTRFYGHPDKTYLLDDYTRFITMEEVMREFVAEVRVRKLQDELSLRVKNLPYRVYFDNPPLVLLDGLPIFNLAKLMEFDPLKIKKLEVVARKFFSGNQSIEGILSYSTYNGNLDGFSIDPGAIVLDFQGLQFEREFYSPAYETKAQIASRIPDFRNLLYWNPKIETGGQDIQQLNFYTSDRPGKYVVLVQGINSNGLAGSQVAFFTVEK